MKGGGGDHLIGPVAGSFVFCTGNSGFDHRGDLKQFIYYCEETWGDKIAYPVHENELRRQKLDVLTTRHLRLRPVVAQMIVWESE